MSDLRRVFEDVSFELEDTSGASPMWVSFARHDRQERIADMHYHLELGIMTQGRAERVFGDYTIPFGPGDIWFIGIFEPHILYIQQVPAEITVLTIDPAFLANLRFTDSKNENWLAPFLLPPRERPVCNAEQRKQMLEIAQRFRSPQKNSAWMQWNCLLLLEVLLTAGLSRKITVNETMAAHTSFSKLRRALELTLTGSDRITADAAACACSMSRRNFDRLFTRALGISFAQFSLRCRLQKAARALACTDKPLKNIADDFCFTDTAHFANAFKSFFGCTPKEYRKGCQSVSI